MNVRTSKTSTLDLYKIQSSRSRGFDFGRGRMNFLIVE